MSSLVIPPPLKEQSFCLLTGLSHFSEPCCGSRITTFKFILSIHLALPHVMLNLPVTSVEMAVPSLPPALQADVPLVPQPPIPTLDSPNFADGGWIYIRPPHCTKAERNKAKKDWKCKWLMTQGQAGSNSLPCECHEVIKNTRVLSQSILTLCPNLGINLPRPLLPLQRKGSLLNHSLQSCLLRPLWPLSLTPPQFSTTH